MNSPGIPHEPLRRCCNPTTGCFQPFSVSILNLEFGSLVLPQSAIRSLYPCPLTLVHTFLAEPKTTPMSRNAISRHRVPASRTAFHTIQRQRKCPSTTLTLPFPRGQHAHLASYFKFLEQKDWHVAHPWIQCFRLSNHCQFTFISW